MSEEMKRIRAEEVYKTILSALDKREWKYKKEEDKLIVSFGVNGKDIPMQFVMVVNTDRQMVSLMSPLSFKMSEDKRVDGAIAACVASFGMVDGSFDYNLETGSIVFRMTESFRESTLGEGLFQYMISCACAMVDEYNDKFLAINKGFMSIDEFIKKRYEK